MEKIYKRRDRVRYYGIYFKFKLELAIQQTKLKISREQSV